MASARSRDVDVTTEPSRRPRLPSTIDEVHPRTAPQPAVLPFGMRSLRQALGSGALSVHDVIDEVLRRIARRGHDAVWISNVEPAALHARAAELEALRAAGGDLPPLFGVPFALKDNIDLAGLPTAAGCPTFAYLPERDAGAVRRMLDAGAIAVGKTNLDQFATGLNGTRSPYGAPESVFGHDLVPGGPAAPWPSRPGWSRSPWAPIPQGRDASRPR